MKIIHFPKNIYDISAAAWQAQFGFDPVWEMPLSYAEPITEEAKALYECTANRAHITGYTWNRICIDVNQFSAEGFIPVMHSGAILITSNLAAKFRNAGLTGFRTLDVVDVACNQTNIAALKLLVFEITGRGGSCLNYIVVEDNWCNVCGYGPLVCTTCGQLNNPCPGCNYSISLESSNQRLVVLEDAWDGSDFFEVFGHWGGSFVSRRAREVIRNMGVVGIGFDDALLRPK